MPKKKIEIYEIKLGDAHINNGYIFTFNRVEDNIVVRAVTSSGRWYIKPVSIEDIRTLLDIDPKVKIVIKED